jgi:hypothetical protein
MWRFAALVLFSTPSTASALEISNFKSGLACTHTRLEGGDPQGWVCQPTQDVLVTDQGSCVYNGQEKRCTWIGFEFDYRNASKDQKLQCVARNSEPVDSGNPGKVIGKDLRSENYEIPLPAGEGHFFNPQYFVFNVRTKADPDSVLQQTFTCSASGKVMFEAKFNLRLPVVDEPST